MLYLNPPYFLIDGVSIFPDHADPLQFYYLPMMPHLTMTQETGGGSVPQLQLIEYRGAAGTGGFLNFDVNLGIDDDALQNVTQQLKQQAQLSDTPRLSPVTFVDGTVKLLILGSESPDPSAPAPATPPATDASGERFVIKIQNAAKPALYGENQATFSVQLDQYGATVMAQALQGDMAPVAVIYSLDFIALRPAFNVKLSVDWDRVHKYVDDQFSGGFLFFSSDVDKAVDKLIDDRAISIEVDSFTPDGTDKTASGDKDRAVEQVYDMIKDTFFEPSMPPEGSGDNTAGTAREIAQLIGSGGGAMVSKKSVDLTQVDKKTLDVNISERTAVQRTIYPQGHIAGLFDVLKQGGVDLSRFIIQVDTDDPYFQRRTLAVSTTADFATDQIASIDVELDYGGITKSVTLNANATSASVDWSSQLVGGQMVRPVTYSYTVNFAGTIDTAQRPSQLTSAKMQVTSDALAIDPREDLYAITVIPIRADNLPFDRYPNVEVECRYVDPVDGLTQQASSLLNAQSYELNWAIFMRDRTQRSFEYRLTYALATGGTKVTPWTTTDEGKVDIVDPMPSKINLTILAAVDWDTVSQVLVSVAYPSKDKPTAHQSYLITAQTQTLPVFVAERPDGGPSTVYYEARIIGPHGHLWTVPGSITTDQTLTITDNMPGHQVITVAPEAVDFAAKQIDEIDVQLRYVDAKNQINANDSIVLAKPTDAQDFSFDYIDPTIHAEYRADIRLGNGQTKSVDWTPVGSPSVTIPLSQID